MLDDPRLISILVVVVLAALARGARALTTSGALAGIAVGGCVAMGYAGPGLVVLGAFFVIGSGATKVGWAKKTSEGTAERGDGARDAQRVIGKGGVAALAGIAAALEVADPAWLAAGLSGALAAALADTLGTEIGTLSKGKPRLLPLFQAAPRGTPGAVSVAGTLAAMGGAAAIGATAWAVGILAPSDAALAAAAGFVGALVESVITSSAPGFRRVPGWGRNVLTTSVGGGLALLGWGMLS